MRILLVLAFLLALLPLSAEEKQQLWFYYPTNLQVTENVGKLEAIWKRAAAAGYTHVMFVDSKMSHLGQLGDNTKRYFENLEKTKKIAADLNLEIVPCVCPIGYSAGILWHDQNLAEGLPVKNTLFEVKGGEAKVVADPPVELKAKPSYADPSLEFKDGIATVTKAQPGNQRMNFAVKVSPYRCYHVHVEIKTKDWTIPPQIKVLGKGREIQFQNIQVAHTQDWKPYDVVFDSLEYSDVVVYMGAWGTCGGQLQFKDWRIEEVGLVNVLRREGTPLVVEGYTEGKDFEKISDPRLGVVPWPGAYESWHTPPTIKTKLPHGTKLRVSWYFPPFIYDEEVGACPADPKTYEVMADEIKRVKAALNPKGLMMSHDEIRCWNFCEACEKKKMTSGELLAFNVRECQKLCAGTQAYIWNDMFDPFHNAHPGDYYLVKGTFEKSWEGLDKDTVIMNWNYGKRDESLKFFADRGHKQILCGFYDETMEHSRDWYKSGKKVPGVLGMMYTTWANDFSKLEEFAKIAKGE